MSRKRIIVLTPRNLSPKGTIPRVHMPLGALMVASQLESDGFVVKLFDTSIGHVTEKSVDQYFEQYSQDTIYDGVEYWKTGLSDDEILRTIFLYKPDLICFSCTTVVDREDTKYLIEMLRNEMPSIPIILGGHEVTHNYQQILDPRSIERDKINGVTCISLGLAQPYITELCKYVLGNKDGELPLNSAWNVNGKVVAKQDNKPVFNINEYALPNYNLLEKVYVDGRQKPYDIYSFIGNTHAGNIKVLSKITSGAISYFPIFTSFGCGNSCTFCDTDKYLIRYNVSNVKEMINAFEDLYGIDYVDFMDNNFAGGNVESRNTCFQILEYVHQKKYKIGFSNGLTFESMMRNKFELLQVFSRYENVAHISFPCENGNDRILKMIRKPHNIEMINRTLEVARQLLPDTNKEGFFIGGFPDTLGHNAETPEEIFDTINYIEHLLENNLLNQAIFLKLSPVTSIYREMWNDCFPDKSFAHCLFSKGTSIWPYDNRILEDARLKTHQLNLQHKSKTTRML